MQYYLGNRITYVSQTNILKYNNPERSMVPSYSILHSGGKKQTVFQNMLDTTEKPIPMPGLEIIRAYPRHIIKSAIKVENSNACILLSPTHFNYWSAKFHSVKHQCL